MNTDDKLDVDDAEMDDVEEAEAIEQPEEEQ